MMTFFIVKFTRIQNPIHDEIVLHSHLEITTTRNMYKILNERVISSDFEKHPKRHASENTYWTGFTRNSPTTTLLKIFLIFCSVLICVNVTKPQVINFLVLLKSLIYQTIYNIADGLKIVVNMMRHADSLYVRYASTRWTQKTIIQEQNCGIAV